MVCFYRLATCRNAVYSIVMAVSRHTEKLEFELAALNHVRAQCGFEMPKIYGTKQAIKCAFYTQTHYKCNYLNRFTLVMCERECGLCVCAHIVSAISKLIRFYHVSQAQSTALPQLQQLRQMLLLAIQRFIAYFVYCLIVFTAKMCKQSAHIAADDDDTILLWTLALRLTGC